MFFSGPGLKSFQKYVLKVLQEVLEAFSRFLGLDPFQKSKFNTKLKFMEPIESIKVESIKKALTCT